MMAHVQVGALALALAATAVLSGCVPKVEESPEYIAACEGSPLRTSARRQQALEDGYNINPQFDCIDKASYRAEAEVRAAYEAANTPQAREAQRRQQEEMYARWTAERKRREALDEARSLQRVVLSRVDVNTASETEIAAIFTVGPELAAQILTEREKRRFGGWDDLITRVAGLGAAQTVFDASTCGLTVDGRSMPGAPIDARVAASIYQRRHGQQAVVEIAP